MRTSQLHDQPHSAPPFVAEPCARDWAKALASYRQPSNARALIELAVTVVPAVALWVSMWFALTISYWLALALAVPAAAFLVRMFMIQHDCGHGSFFRQRFLNDWTGRAIGVLTLTPYGVWRRTHAMHHANSGCLERRGHGDIDTLTVCEYRSLPTLGRLRYRLYRHPLVMFGLGPAYLFILQHRFPGGLWREGWQPWSSAMGTNLSIALVILGAVWFIGLKAFLLIHLPVTLLAASAGVWLFFVQHQFEHTSWEPQATWDWHDAALHGSSHYDLPGLLHWLTANIGVHHVHHLSSRIPYYRLRNVLRDYPALANASRLTLFESLRCVRLVLWHDEEHRLVSFKDAALS